MSAMLALTDWPRLFGLPTNTVKGICPISGLFDLRPFPHTWLAPKLQLTPEEVDCNSPLFLLHQPAAPMLIAYGADETSEFHRQAAEMHKGCVKAEISSSLLPILGCGHSRVINGLVDPGSVLCRAIAKHVEDTTNSVG
jgi:arylformamidase